VTLGTGAEVLAVELVEARAGQAQLLGGLAGGKLSAAMAGQEMADQRSGKTFDEL